MSLMLLFFVGFFCFLFFFHIDIVIVPRTNIAVQDVGSITRLIRSYLFILSHCFKCVVSYQVVIAPTYSPKIIPTAL